MHVLSHPFAEKVMHMLLHIDLNMTPFQVTDPIEEVVVSPYDSLSMDALSGVSSNPNKGSRCYFLEQWLVRN